MFKYFTVIFACALLPVASPALAYVASSSHYRIQADSINFGGGISSSSDYSVKDTLGESGIGIGTGGANDVRAGYRHMLESGISVSAPASIAMSPDIVGKAGGGGTRTANGSGIIKVITDDPAGYLMYVKAATTPALASGENSFADYVEAATWEVSSANSSFGFNVSGLHAVSANWFGFSTLNKKIAESNNSNQPTGTDTTLNVRATIGADKKQAAGNYVANLTVTVLPL